MEKVIIPDRQEFTPAQVAEILSRRRSTVEWWMDNNKLTWGLDYRQRRVILRADLIAFASGYLSLTVQMYGRPS